MTTEIEGFLERMVPDIARKCGVKTDVVLDVMYKLCNKRKE